MKKVKYIFSILTILTMGSFIIWAIFEIGSFRIEQQVKVSNVQSKDSKYRTAKDYNEHKEKNSSFSKSISRVLKNKHFRGTAYVVENNQVILNENYDMKQGSKLYPNRAMDQLLTSTVMMQYVTRGKVKLDTKVSHFFPHIKGAKNITIRNLINMTSGITGSPVMSSENLSDEEVIEETVQQTSINKKKIGQQVDSSINYVLLAGIIEKLSKHHFSTVMENTFFSPYKLKHSVLINSAKNIKKVVSGHTGSKQKLVRLNSSEVVPNIGYNRYAYTAGDVYFMMKTIFQGGVMSRSQVYALLNNDIDVEYNAGFARNISGAWIADVASFGTHTLTIMSESGNQSVILQTNTDTTKYYMYGLGKKIYAKLNKNLNTFPSYAKYQ